MMVGAQLESLRPSLASRSVARALALSLFLHVFVCAVLELGFQTGLWNETLRLFKPRAPDDLIERLLAQARERQQQEQEMPLVFIEVDPSQASPEPPKDSQFYSSLNSRAANPDTSKDTLVPKIEGKQDKVPQTKDRALEEPKPLQPAPPPPAPQIAEVKPQPEPPKPEPKPEPPPEPKPAPKLELKPPPGPGDLAMVKPVEKPPLERPPVERPAPVVPTPSPAPPPSRPRRLAEAMRQKGIAGEKMNQPGGVRRFALDSSFDVKATPFGTYDAAIIAAVQKRWYDLLDARSFSAHYSGKVVLEFRLNSDGRVTDMRVNENDVTELLALLCQRAVSDPAPFAPWPADLRRLVGKDYREVRFTFYYQ